ncbi:hypothetical protein G6F65_016454 [Rhizopus arrhizus]|nr:hypothetical protein G6F65_016454 [Rhizopus arrhizus]
MAARAGAHAIRHVPGAECRRIAFRQRTVVLLRALLERLLRLLGRGFTADRQAALETAALATATTAAIFAHVVEATQLAAFISGVVAVDVGIATATLAHAHGGLGGAALADHRLQGQRRRRAFFQLQLRAQGFHLGGTQFPRMAAGQFARQADLAVAGALQAADLAALRFPQAAHFAVAAFLHHDAEPVVRIRAADALDLVELGRAVFQCNAAGEAVDDGIGDLFLAFRGTHAHHVLALDLERRVHHGVGQLTVGGGQQQAGGVDVEAADRDPARALQRRQRFEHGRAAFGVFAGGHFAFRLVVDQHARRLGQGGGDEAAAVQLDLVAALDRHAGLRDFTVDLDQAFGDALFQRAPRAEAGLRQREDAMDAVQDALMPMQD